MVAGPVFEDDLEPWSGDRCIDPRLVPGVFFCNRKVDAEEPALIDIAPTALRLFGIEPPAHIDGKTIAGPASTRAGRDAGGRRSAAGRQRGCGDVRTREPEAARSSSSASIGSITS